LKKKGDLFQYQEFNIPVDEDEEIRIDDSFLIKTLVHNFSHDPETLERFLFGTPFPPIMPTFTGRLPTAVTWGPFQRWT
jgi:hypothetical protein